MRRARLRRDGRGARAVGWWGAVATSALLCSLSLLSGCLPERRASGSELDASVSLEDIGGSDGGDVLGVQDAGGVDIGGAEAPDIHVVEGCTKDSQCADLQKNLCHKVSCDTGTGLCKIELRADGSGCGEDTPCGVAPSCQKGLCVYKPKSCSDDNPCTIDSCLPAMGCTHTPVLDGTKVPCNDGDLCTREDVCLGGKCVGKKFLAKNYCPGGDDICLIAGCDPKKGCVVIPLGENANCDDGDKCTKNTKCTAEGECVGQPVKCPDDGNPCTIGTCLSGNTDKHGCQPEVPIPGLFCGASDPKYPCKENFVCQLLTPESDPTVASNWQCKGSPKVCEGLDAACLTCSVADGGKCKPGVEKEGNPCGDGGPCVEAGKCKGGKCEGETKKDCDDGNLCTTDACDPLDGCVHQPLAATAVCDDGNPCTKGDVCAKKAVCAGVDACDDGNPCTKDLCGPAGCLTDYLKNASACASGGQCWGGVCVVSKCPNGACDYDEDPSKCAADCPVGGGLCDPKDAGFAKCMSACQAGQCKTQDTACAQSSGCQSLSTCMTKAADDAGRLQCLSGVSEASAGAFFALNTCLKSKCEKNAWWGKVCALGPTQGACVQICGVYACQHAHITCYGDPDCVGLDKCVAQCKTGDQGCVKLCQAQACKAGCQVGDSACASGCTKEAVFSQQKTVVRQDALVKCRQIKCY